MSAELLVMLLALASLAEALRARAAERRLRRDVETHTKTLRISHQLAEMQEREIDRIEEHVGLSRIESPKEGPYR